MDSLFDGLTYPVQHIQSCEEAWQTRATDEWVHLFVHTLDSNPRHWYMETKLCHSNESWYTLTYSLYLTFEYQSEYPLVDDALELVHMKIAENPLPICTQIDGQRRSKMPENVIISPLMRMKIHGTLISQSLKAYTQL